MFQTYTLVSVVTHYGISQNCGHYTAVGQSSDGEYYSFDDNTVRPIPVSDVLGSNSYIMFFEKDITEEISASTASTSNVVYGPQLPSNIGDKGPLKTTLYRNQDKKPILLNSTSVVPAKLDVKPILLNSTLGHKFSELNRSNSEPWVVKQNGEVEKIIQPPKTLNGIDKIEDKKISIAIKRQNSGENVKPKLSKYESDLRTFTGTKSVEKFASTTKQVKTLKSPLEKLEEQMNRNESSAPTPRNDFTGSRLVPYDSESSCDERNDAHDEGRRPKPSRCASPRGLVVTTKSMHHVWTVSSEKNGPLLSPSLNGVTNKK